MNRITPSSSTIFDWYYDWCVQHAQDKQRDLQNLLTSAPLFNWYKNMLATQEPSVTRLMLQAKDWEQKVLWQKQRDRILFRYPKIILKKIRETNTN